MRHARTYVMSSAVVAAAVLAGLSAGPPGLVANAATHHAATHLGDLPSDAPVTVVASGLAEPRNMAWGPHHELLTTIAGLPPTNCQGTGTAAVCFGQTGMIDKIVNGNAIPIVQGLVSVEDQAAMTGPESLVYEHGQLFTLELGAPQEIPPWVTGPVRQSLETEMGSVLNVTGGNVSVVADPGRADYQWTQEHQNLTADFPDSNPYDLIANPHGGGFYLVDAAADTLDSVDRSGNVHVLAFIPNIQPTIDGVPTCLAMGPGGDVYVGELSGHTSPAGAASVFKYNPRTGKLSVWLTGFSAITGCGFGANGDFYVVETDTDGVGPPFIDTGGAVIQVSHDGTRTELAHNVLHWPVGFLAGPDGSVYTINNSVIWPILTGSPTEGQIVKIG